MGFTPYQPMMPGLYPSVQGGYNPTPYQPSYQAELPNLTGRYVTSEAEARGAQVDFMAPANLFPDLANRVIYAKVLNRNTGAMDFIEFRAVPPRQEAPQMHAAEAYAPMAALERLEARVKALEGPTVQEATE